MRTHQPTTFTTLPSLRGSLFDNPVTSVIGHHIILSNTIFRGRGIKAVKPCPVLVNMLDEKDVLSLPYDILQIKPLSENKFVCSKPGSIELYQIEKSMESKKTTVKCLTSMDITGKWRLRTAPYTSLEAVSPNGIIHCRYSENINRPYFICDLNTSTASRVEGRLPFTHRQQFITRSLVGYSTTEPSYDSIGEKKLYTCFSLAHTTTTQVHELMRYNFKHETECAISPSGQFVCLRTTDKLGIMSISSLSHLLPQSQQPWLLTRHIVSAIKWIIRDNQEQLIYAMTDEKTETILIHQYTPRTHANILLQTIIRPPESSVFSLLLLPHMSAILISTINNTSCRFNNYLLLLITDNELTPLLKSSFFSPFPMDIMHIVSDYLGSDDTTALFLLEKERNIALFLLQYHCQILPASAQTPIRLLSTALENKPKAETFSTCVQRVITTSRIHEAHLSEQIRNVLNFIRSMDEQMAPRLEAKSARKYGI